MKVETGNEMVVNMAASTPLWRRCAPLAVLAGLIVFAIAMGWHRYLTLTNLYDQRVALQSFIADHLLLALVAYAALYVAVTALSIPGALPLTIAGGFLFGFLNGTIATVVGATIGATLLFLIVRSSIGEGLAARAGPFVGKLAEGFRSDAFNYLLFLRLVPAFPFVVVNLVPALCGVTLRTFFWATLIGIIPGTAAFAFAGSGLDSVFAAQGAPYDACKASGASDCVLNINPGSLVTWQLLLAFAALGAVSLLPVLLKRAGWGPRPGGQ